jgi:hypothetical protein
LRGEVDLRIEKEIMWRLAAISIAATLMSAMPADTQSKLLGYFPVLDPNGRLVVEPHYAPSEAHKSRNIVAVRADGNVIFCFCGGTSF